MYNRANKEKDDCSSNMCIFGNCKKITNIKMILELKMVAFLRHNES
jgi:hypothetical protein